MIQFCQKIENNVVISNQCMEERVYRFPGRDILCHIREVGRISENQMKNEWVVSLTGENAPLSITAQNYLKCGISFYREMQISMPEYRKNDVMI